MLSYLNIKTIATYESKILFRTWFFKIFAILSVFLLSLFHVVTNFNLGMDSWPFHALPANVPYINIKFLNIIQSIIAIFLASGFLKKDKKLDTSVVIYVRPMSNAEYVFGKTIGVFKLFMGLNLFSLLIAYLICTFSSGSIVNIIPYIIYPIIISIPSLFFVFGLSFVTMSFIKNQSITFLLLLGYIGLCVFYLGSEVSPIFDYTSFNLPLLYSDIAGFSNLKEILLHRSGYLFIGVSFILITIIKLDRLPNNPRKIKRYYIFSLLFIIMGASGLFTIWSDNNYKDKQINTISNINNIYFDTPNITIISNHISLLHESDIIRCSSKLKIKNNRENSLTKYTLSLNPGLKIDEIKYKNKNLNYKRIENIVIIDDNIKSEESKQIELKYSGSINENACYLDIPSTKKKERFQYFGLNIPKKYAFIQKDYLLLTPESNWYPTTSLSYNPKKLAIGRYQFTDFSLSVKTNKNLFAISQGQMTQKSDGEYHFKSEHPLTQISLFIGEYVKQEIKVDSINYSLFVKKGHSYFSPVFESIKDTVPSLIRSMLTDYELKQKRKYPYKRITIVEAPIQFSAYKRLWTNHYETVQPEIVILPELGLTMPDSDFASRVKKTLKWRKRHDENIKENDVKSEIFTRNMYNLFLSDEASNSVNSDEISLMGITSFNEQIYSLYPNFYTFTNHIHSEKFPILGCIMEGLTKDETQSRKERWASFLGGITKQELANIDIENKSLKEILSEPTKHEKTISDIINNKANQLKAIILSRVDKAQLREDLSNFYNSNIHKSISFEEFSSFLNKNYNINIEGKLDDWYNDNKTSGFVIHSIQGTKVDADDEKKFQIKIKISNLEPTDGAVSLKIILQNNSRGRVSYSKRMANALEYSYILKGNSSYEIGIITGMRPVFMSINTLVSKNIPSIISQRFEEFEESNEESFAGIREISLQKSNDIIVDNEDSGFEYFQDIKEKKLKKLINSSNSYETIKYSQLEPWSPPSKWTLFAKEGQYGKYVKSAYYARSGENNKKAIWTANITKSGYYEVFFFYQTETRNFRRRNSNRSASLKYYLEILSDDGKTNFDLDLNGDNDEGWFSLGRYYFSKGEAKVILSDKSNSNSIIADAVKWVLKE